MTSWGTLWLALYFTGGGVEIHNIGLWLMSGVYGIEKKKQDTSNFRGGNVWYYCTCNQNAFIRIDHASSLLLAPLNSRLQYLIHHSPFEYVESIVVVLLSSSFSWLFAVL
jgi:hypothetical protein